MSIADGNVRNKVSERNCYGTHLFSFGIRHIAVIHAVQSAMNARQDLFFFVRRLRRYQVHRGQRDHRQRIPNVLQCPGDLPHSDWIVLAPKVDESWHDPWQGRLGLAPSRTAPHAHVRCRNGYLLPVTSRSTRRSGCRHRISSLVLAVPLQSSVLVTGAVSPTPCAETLLAGMPDLSTR